MKRGLGEMNGVRLWAPAPLIRVSVSIGLSGDPVLAITCNRV